MVPERHGDWRLAWRFALAGVTAGILVIALAQTGVTRGTFRSSWRRRDCHRSGERSAPSLLVTPGATTARGSREVVRSLRCSAAPSILTTCASNLSARLAVMSLARAADLLAEASSALALTGAG